MDGRRRRDVELVGEAGRELDRRVDGERSPDPARNPRALQQRRRLDRAAAHDHVAERDRPRRPSVNVVVACSSVAARSSAAPRFDSRSPIVLPRRLHAGRYVRVMLCRCPAFGSRSGYAIHRGISLFCQPSASAPRRSTSAGAVGPPGAVADADRLFDFVARWPAARPGRGRRCRSRPPPLEDVGGRAAVEAAVDLRAAAGAAAFGVRDRGRPSATVTPPERYWRSICSSENGATEPCSIQSPSSTTSTSKPASASNAAVVDSAGRRNRRSAPRRRCRCVADGRDHGCRAGRQRVGPASHT